MEMASKDSTMEVAEKMMLETMESLCTDMIATYFTQNQ